MIAYVYEDTGTRTDNFIITSSAGEFLGKKYLKYSLEDDDIYHLFYEGPVVGNLVIAQVKTGDSTYPLIEFPAMGNDKSAIGLEVQSESGVTKVYAIFYEST